MLSAPLYVSPVPPLVFTKHPEAKVATSATWSVTLPGSYSLPSPSCVSSRLLIAVGTVGAGGGLFGAGIRVRDEAVKSDRKMLCMRMFYTDSLFLARLQRVCIATTELIDGVFWSEQLRRVEGSDGSLSLCRPPGLVPRDDHATQAVRGIKSTRTIGVAEKRPCPKVSTTSEVDIE